MTRKFVLLASLFAGLGVLAGAFGSHALAAMLTASGRAATYDTAVQYQMYHALALLLAGWLGDKWPGRSTRWAGYLFALGIVIFSGSLYVLAIFNVRFMGAVTPLGGVAFVAGWICLGIAAWQSKASI